MKITGIDFLPDEIMGNADYHGHKFYEQVKVTLEIERGDLLDLRWTWSDVQHLFLVVDFWSDKTFRAYSLVNQSVISLPSSALPYVRIVQRANET